MDWSATMQLGKIADPWLASSVTLPCRPTPLDCRPAHVDCLGAGKLPPYVRSQLLDHSRADDHAHSNTRTCSRKTVDPPSPLASQLANLEIFSTKVVDFPFLLGTESVFFPSDHVFLPLAPLSASDVQLHGSVQLPSDFSCGSPDQGQVTCRFSAFVQSVSLKVEEEKSGEVDDNHVNTGYAIRTLRDELPVLFHKEMNYSIYRDDIVFCDPRNTFGGLRQYKRIFFALRFYGRILFKALWMDVIRIWQPSESVIMVRWAVRGIARIPWENRGQFDGISEYKLDKQGKIYEHRVHNVLLSSPTKSSTELARIFGYQAKPKPCIF